MICRRRRGAPWRALLNPCALALTVLATAAPAALAAPPAVFNPVAEAQNFSITQQRQAIYDTPAYQAALAADGTASAAQALAAQAGDPQRFFTDDLCWSLQNGCAGDIRLNDWAARGDGLVRPVLFTARDGATLSGHVWATVAGPAHRPAVVITNGSVQADEQMYWFIAQTLAKAGYVVLTFDPQGQGQSDTFGAGADRTEGVPGPERRPALLRRHRGRDRLHALDARRTRMRPRAQLQHRHQPRRQAGRPRQQRALTPATTRSGACSTRAGSGSSATPTAPPASPTSRSGIPRVRAVVALDNLGGPGPRPAPRSAAAPAARVPSASSRCPADPGGAHHRADHQARARASPPTTACRPPQHVAARSRLQGPGVLRLQPGRRRQRRDRHPRRLAPGLQLHPQPGLRRLAARPRHDRLVHDGVVRPLPQGRPRRRWRACSPTAGATIPSRPAVDPNHDGNAFSFYYHSRLDIALPGGGRFDCEELRDGCPGMSSADGYPGDYSYVAIDTAPDAVHGTGASLRAGHGPDALPGASRRRGCAAAPDPTAGDHARARLRRPPAGRSPGAAAAAHGRCCRRCRAPRATGSRVRVVTLSGRSRSRTLVTGCARPAARRTARAGR